LDGDFKLNVRRISMMHKKSWLIKNKIPVILLGIFLATILCGACAVTTYTLKTEEGGLTATSGTYTIVRYGMSNPEDYANFAIIFPEQGKYSFDIYKPDFEYRIEKGLTAKQAMESAQESVRRSPEFSRAQASKIIGPDGNVIGYEVKALYKRTLFGMEDVTYLTYVLQVNNMVTVYIRIDDAVLSRQKGGSGDQQ
jgi:hypothetical protein